MTIIDTSVWIDYFGGAETSLTHWLDKQLGHHQVGLTDLILCEFLQGMRSPSAFNTSLRWLSQFPVLNSGGKAIAVASAENYRTLRAKGHTVRKTIDCLIASVCIVEGHSLLHHDRDFDPFEEHLGLQVIHPQLL